ncbi:hypothetical protein B0H34DRAFT_22568 [Crassisporium funariophilum]|nr:hypothetical protein B0H34DRAFT_22568 [Crassisporium funariophilum]
MERNMTILISCPCPLAPPCHICRRNICICGVMCLRRSSLHARILCPLHYLLSSPHSSERDTLTYLSASLFWAEERDSVRPCPEPTLTFSISTTQRNVRTHANLSYPRLSIISPPALNTHRYRTAFQAHLVAGPCTLPTVNFERTRMVQCILPSADKRSAAV